MQFWDVLSVAGGGLALAFIVGIIVGIATLVMLFIGSAVVVLEQFARATRSVPRLLLVTLVWALLLAPLLFDLLYQPLAGAPLEVRFPMLARAALMTSLLVLLAECVVGLLLRFARGEVLGRIALWSLAAGYALVVGGIGRPLLSAVPAAVMLLALLWLRRRRGMSRFLAACWISAVLLSLGIPLAAMGGSAVAVETGSLVIGLVIAAIGLGLVPLAASGFLESRSGYEWFIATRYLFAKRRQTFISVITAICVGGVAAGVWLIVTVLSVMNGFERTWRDEIIGNRAHFTVHSPLGTIDDYTSALTTLDAVDGVVGAAPYVDAEGMVRGGAGEIIGVRVRGIDADRIASVTDLASDLIAGSEQALEQLRPSAAEFDAAEDPPLLVGNQLASSLGLLVGDPVLVVVPFGGPATPFGPGPRLKRFRLAGIFESSFFQYDEIYTYTSLAAAQDFRRLGDVVSGIEVRTTDFYRSQQVAEVAEAALGFRYYTRDWKEFFPAFFQALKTERIMMFVLLTMIMVVAAFAIVVTLIMMIMEKSSDIAILKTMGARDEAVERVFAIEGTLIGLLGTALGIVAGIAVTTQLDWVQRQIEGLTGIDTLPASIYQFSTLPWELDPGQIAIVATIAMILSLGATLLPSRHGARLAPAEALRYE
jgi:lipoprotein-releasing system permease protein